MSSDGPSRIRPWLHEPRATLARRTVPFSVRWSCKPALLLIAQLLLPVLASAGESLWLLPNVRPEALVSLAGRGVVVSRVERERAFVFCPDPGCEPFVAGFPGAVLLDAASEKSEHYLLFADDVAGLAGLTSPMRLLDHRDGVAVVAAPPGSAERVAALGFETVKLFRTSMRLTPRASPRSLLAMLVTPREVDSLVAEVAVESIDATVARLQGFGTRRATKLGGSRAAQWIANRFRGYGIQDVVIDELVPGIAGNVVATVPGRSNPQDVYIIGGHYDSIVPNSDFEPGADDNASGTAGVLECARILARFPMSSTVRFIAFGGEELGLLGSEAYAGAASERGEWITGMFNLDMIGYRAPPSRRDLDVIANPYSTWMYDAIMRAATQFVPELPVVRGKLLSGSSDHASFWRHYYSAVFLHEDTHMSSPYLHTVDDVIGTSYNDSMLAWSTTRVLVATVATLAAGPLVPVAFESWTATPLVTGVLLEWIVAADAGAVGVGIEVESAESPYGPFRCLTPQPLPGTSGRYLDTMSSADRPAWYRLAVRMPGDRTFYSPSIEATPVASAGASRLEPIAQIGAGTVQVHYRVGAGAGVVRLEIHDVRGRLVKPLFEGRCDPGDYAGSWDGRTGTGASAARGVYFVVLRANDGSDCRRLLWLRP